MNSFPAASLAAAMRQPRRRYLRSPWPWRALWWGAQMSAAGWVLFGLISLAVFPAATGVWDLRGPWWSWLAELAAIAVAVGGFCLVGVWQRRAVVIVGVPPIASRSAWLTPGARRGWDVVAGVGQDLVAGAAVLIMAAGGTVITWLCWVWPMLTVGGAVGLTLWATGNEMDNAELNVGFNWAVAVLAVLLTVLLPWLWGWLALGGSRLLSRIYDRRGDVARRQVLERQAATIRLTDLFSAERHRIERDLHDGAQQRIVALGFTLGLLEHELAGLDTHGEARRLVRKAAEENQEVLADLRNLVRAIRPQVLTDLGLEAGLEEVAARHPIPTRVVTSISVRPDALVEETAYFVVVEALTNAARHADAEAIKVEVSDDRDDLTVIVADDGQGGVRIREGGGIAGLIDRVAALGGHLEVVSPPGGPTRVTARIPLRVPYDRARSATAEVGG